MFGYGMVQGPSAGATDLDKSIQRPVAAAATITIVASARSHILGILIWIVQLV